MRSADLPAALSDGQYAEYAMPWADFRRVNSDWLLSEYKGRAASLKVRFLSFRAYTSTGNYFSARVNRDLQLQILEFCKGIRSLEKVATGTTGASGPA
jgi:hypothetical protein